MTHEPGLGQGRHPARAPADAAPGRAGRVGPRAAVITVSDEVAAGAEDRGGLLALDLLAAAGLPAQRVVVPDQPDRIRAAIRTAITEGCRFVLTCGGTGIGPTDHTADVIRGLIAFDLPGIAEEIRRRGAAQTPLALVSRQVAGAILGPGHPPVFVLAAPGSRGGVRDALAVVVDLVPYVLDQLDGAGHG